MRKILLLISLLLAIVTPITACSEKYYYGCHISGICADQRDNWAYLEFELDEGEILSGKISVYETSTTVLFFHSEPDTAHLLAAAENPVTVGMLEDYTFKVQAERPTRVRCYFLYTGWSMAPGDFYCNIQPVETWVQNSDSPNGAWDEPTMYSPPLFIRWGVRWNIITPVILVGIALLIILSLWLIDRLSSRKRQKQ